MLRPKGFFIAIRVLAIVFFLLVLSTCNMLNENKSKKAFFAAELTSVDSYLYGRFVVRMQAAKASGVISNFFTFKNDGQRSDVTWQEIDVEVFGKNDASQWQSNIIVDLEERIRNEALHSAVMLAETYNTYAIEWTPNYVKWSINGKVVRTVTSRLVDGLTDPASFRFNIWLPNDPDWVGYLRSDLLPVEMYVNWMEYHRWNGDFFELEWRDDFDFLNAERWLSLNHTFERNLAQFTHRNVAAINGYLVLSVTKNPYSGFSGIPPLDESAR